MDYSSFALSFNGVKQGSERHKQIIDYYNQHIRPLPRGYKATTKDSWCAIFASFVMHNCKAINAPYECSVFYMFKNAEKNKQIIYNNPQPNDLIIFDWDLDGTKDHVGFITHIENNFIYTIEGNKNHAVGTRRIGIKNRCIACFIRVPNNNNNATNYYEDLAIRVINGEFGNGEVRKKRIEALGVNYRIVQDIVNQKLGGKK